MCVAAVMLLWLYVSVLMVCVCVCSDVCNYVCYVFV